jgi:signal peptidase I
MTADPATATPRHPRAEAVIPHARGRTDTIPGEHVDGWGWFIATTVSRTYLFFLLTLAVIAVAPALLGWQGSVVQSGSMEPHISAGDVVLLAELPDDTPVPLGGVVSFRNSDGRNAEGPDEVRLHRIVGQGEGLTFVTAGDANADVDSTPLTREQITGQARLLVPYVGLPGLWLGRGEFAPIAVWAILTLFGLVTVVRSLAPDHRRGGSTPPGSVGPTTPGTDTDTDTDSGTGSEPEESVGVDQLLESGSPEPRSAGRRSVITALPLIGGLALLGTVLGARPVSAAFSARTATANSWQAAVSFGTRLYYNYRGVIARDSPWAYYPMDEAPGIYTAEDFSGSDRDATYSSAGITMNRPGALVNETNRAITLNGTSGATFSTPANAVAAPQRFTVELWFRTGTGQGGQLAGFGNVRSGASGQYDRLLYMDSSGRLNFGVYNGSTRVVTSSTAYNDSSWHHVAVSLGTAGMALHVDGRLVGSNTNAAAEPINGYWRIGGDNTAGWPNRPVNTFFAGSIDELAIYPVALTTTRINAHFQAALRTTTGNYPTEVMNDRPGHYYHFEEGTPGVLADFSGNAQDSVYPASGVTYNVAGPLAQMNNLAALFNGTSGSMVGKTLHTNPQIFSVEAWFATTTTRGGQIIGFANSTSLTAGQHDRHLYMINDGRVVFGIYPGIIRYIFSPRAYNDGAWHHLVATLSTAGMFLYLDGALVASDTRYRSAEAYNGYWQIGAGPLSGWPSQPTSTSFAGTLDEIAIYTQALTAAQVSAHHAAR